MTSSPDRPFSTTEQAELVSRRQWIRNQQARIGKARTAADKRTLQILQRDLTEVDAELSYRDWLAMDDNYPIPKTDPQPPIFTSASRVHEGGDGVCSAANGEGCI